MNDFEKIWKELGKHNTENRGNLNIKFNTKRIAREVLENIEVTHNLSEDDKKLICETVLTTIWELFERKEEQLKYVGDDDTMEWEFKE